MGEYEAMARKHAEQRRVMADPDPSSELGQLIDHIEKAAREASFRSEIFRSSVNAKEMADLRRLFFASKKGGKSAWGAEQKEKFEQVTQPWKVIVNGELTKNSKKLSPPDSRPGYGTG